MRCISYNEGPTCSPRMVVSKLRNGIDELLEDASLSVPRAIALRSALEKCAVELGHVSNSRAEAARLLEELAQSVRRGDCIPV